MDNRLLTIKEVAERLAVGRGAVYRLIRDQKIVPLRFGRSVRFRPEDVAKLIEESRDVPDPDAWGPRAGVGPSR